MGACKQSFMSGRCTLVTTNERSRSADGGLTDVLIWQAGVQLADKDRERLLNMKVSRKRVSSESKNSAPKGDFRLGNPRLVCHVPPPHPASQGKTRRSLLSFSHSVFESCCAVWIHILPPRAADCCRLAGIEGVARERHMERFVISPRHLPSSGDGDESDGNSSKGLEAGREAYVYQSQEMGGSAARAGGDVQPWMKDLFAKIPGKSGRACSQTGEARRRRGRTR
jgi:hypothetical protein